MKRVYFNPGWDPIYFYQLIKPLAIIYDQIVIWSPVLRHLEEANFLAGDFVEACKPIKDAPPAIIPVGRESWFNLALRQSHPDPECREIDTSFESSMHNAALAASNFLGQSAILTIQDREIGYKAVDDIWNTEYGRRTIEKRAGEIASIFPESMIVRIENVANERKRTFPWAIANAFAQDVLAIKRLGSITPMVSMDHAKGYQCLSSITPEEGRPYNSKTLLDPIDSRQELPDLPRGLKANEIKKFLDDAYDASNMTWAEVAKLRKLYGQKIQRWLNEALEYRRRPLSAKTISEVADLRTKALYLSAARQLKIAAIIPPTLLLPFFGIEGLTTGLIVDLLSLFRLKTTLTRVFAKYLGPRVDNFLVDTPFFMNAELGINIKKEGD